MSHVGRDRRCERQTHAEAEVDVGGGEDEREERAEDQAAEGELSWVHGRRYYTMRALSARTLSCLLAAVFGAACATTPRRLEIRDWEVVPDTIGTPFRLFPELGPVDTSYRWFGASVPTDSRAPVCVAAGSAPASWRVERVETSSRFLEALEVAVPPRLAGTARTGFGIPPDADTLGILVATWERRAARAATPLGDQRAPMQVAVWIGPEDGYPTVGADTASTQLYARQCRLRTADAERLLVEFALRGRRTSDEYLGAIWPIGAERYLRVLISGLDSASLQDARAMVGSMRTIPRRR